MPVDLDHYRGAVGTVNSCLHCKNFYSNTSIRNLDVFLIASAFLSVLVTFSMFLLFSKSFCFIILLRKNIKIINILIIRIFHIYILVTFVFHVWFYLILTKRSGDNSSQSFSNCHWNLNSISAHNFIKILFLKTYITTYKLLLYVFQKLILTPVFQMTITI